MKEWINEWVTEWLDDWLTDWISEWVNQCEREYKMIECKNEWLNRQISDWVTEWLLTDWMNKPISEWANERVSKWRGEWSTDWLNEWCVICFSRWATHSLCQAVSKLAASYLARFSRSKNTWWREDWSWRFVHNSEVCYVNFLWSMYYVYMYICIQIYNIYSLVSPCPQTLEIPRNSCKDRTHLENRKNSWYITVINII